MLIGVMSDSHDNLPNIRKAVELFASRGAEALIHAGDFVAPFAVKEILKFPGRAYGVFGNNDGEVNGIRALWRDVHRGPHLFELGGLKILAAHAEADLVKASRDDADVHIFGHNHRAEVRDGRPLVVNPGETGGWLTGSATCAVLDTYGPTAEILEID